MRKTKSWMVSVALLASVVTGLISTEVTQAQSRLSWKQESIWHDGKVEKAVYAASRPIYGRPRTYNAIFFTNKEQHDIKSWTKAAGSTQTAEVFKHHQIDDIPTPNYLYHFRTAVHVLVDDLSLTRMDMGSGEFCGATFKQVTRDGMKKVYQLSAFSYMPEAGRVSASYEGEVVPQNALPILLRDFDFSAPGKSQQVRLLPDQKSHRGTSGELVNATLTYEGPDTQNGSDHRITLSVGGTVLATYWFAQDRLHVMTRYEDKAGQTYRLVTVERADYWTIVGE